MTVRLIQFVPETLPTHRPDVQALFARYLPRLGIGNDIVGYAAGTSAAPAWDGGECIAAGAGKGKLAAHLHFAVALLRAGGGRRHNVLQVRDMVWAGALGLLLARLSGKRFCYWMSFLMSESRMRRARDRSESVAGWKRPLLFAKGWLEYQLLYRLILPNADHVFTQSDAMRDYVAGRGISPDRLSAVPMGVDLERVAAVTPRRWPEWPDGPVVCYLGALDRLRGLEVLVDAIAQLQQVMPGVRLLLIGDGSHPPERAFLEQRAAELGVADLVRVTGWLPSEHAWSLVAGCDLALSYVPRGFLFDVSSPTKLAEYLSIGMPSVANDSPDQAVVLGASSRGWLTDGTPEGFVKSITFALHQPDVARLRAAEGRAYIEQHRSYARLAEGVAAIYFRLAGAQ
ncbi:glycosyltransferase [Jeongeupia naejangsanensis]|uniref:Glycosyltransferase n=1 Tax=Jeongeupia naejangsanensis TaxID=613195 RepID=A0ABS2BHQ2_9NEIS|nr:glycosyltransferase [Jeongeupia naejangsanensis]MBM3115140.1 glycosyltransferase [Jeongeupia naejangsanensis]